VQTSDVLTQDRRRRPVRSLLSCRCVNQDSTKYRAVLRDALAPCDYDHMSDDRRVDIEHKTIPVEEGKSITGSGAVADDPKGPKFSGGPVMSTGSPAPADDD
jgi:hypothetical protein